MTFYRVTVIMLLLLILGNVADPDLVRRAMVIVGHTLLLMIGLVLLGLVAVWILDHWDADRGVDWFHAMDRRDRR